MKKFSKLLGTQSRRLFSPLCAIALAVIIGFSMAACGDADNGSGDDNGGNSAPQTVTYTSYDASGYSYTLLIITQNNVTYVLTIINPSGGVVGTSTGTVVETVGGALTLQPKNSGSDTFSVTVSNGQMTAINGAIAVDEGEPRSPPSELIPNKPNGGGNQTWTAVTNSTFGTDTDIRAIAYGNNKFVAGDYNGKMATSSDGVTWTAVTDSTFGTDRINGIAYGNNKFVAVGQDGKMATSSDGVTWTAVADSTFGTGILSTIEAIAYGNNKFVAVGGPGKMAYSPDGVTWTAVTDSTFGTDIIHAIAYGNNKFVAGGDKYDGSGSIGKMATSSDGVTWTAVSTFDTGEIRAIAYGDNKFVTGGQVREGGSFSGKMAYSPDGVTWTAVTDSTFGTGTLSTIEAIAYGNNKFIAGGQTGKTATSPDGVTWTAVTDSALGTVYIYGITYAYGIRAIAYGNNKFVAVGESGKMAYWADN